MSSKNTVKAAVQVERNIAKEAILRYAQGVITFEVYLPRATKLAKKLAAAHAISRATEEQAEYIAVMAKLTAQLSVETPSITLPVPKFPDYTLARLKEAKFALELVEENDKIVSVIVTRPDGALTEPKPKA